MLAPGGLHAVLALEALDLLNCSTWKPSLRKGFDHANACETFLEE
jgi:hypothetical protein